MSSSSPTGEDGGSAGRLLVDEPAPGVARLTISNPARRGALDHPLLDAFASTLAQLDARCVIVTGEHQTFSAGYDLGGLPDEMLPEQADSLVAHPFAAAIDAVEAYEYPTVAALNGHAIGLRRFIDTIGAARTRELFLVGRRIDARTARAWGLVNAVAEPERLEEDVVTLAIEIAGNAPLAQRGNKRVIRELLAARTALDPETEQELLELRRACFSTADFREGVRAFAEKRPPRWQNR